MMRSFRPKSRPTSAPLALGISVRRLLLSHHLDKDDGDDDTMAAVQSPYSVVVELVPDELDGSLGVRPPIAIGEGSERAFYEENRHATLECRVVHLQRGTFNNEPAVLVAFEFNFIASAVSSSRRIVSADIDVSFDCDPSASAASPAASPGTAVRVVKYSPALAEGPPTEATTARDWAVKPNIGVNTSPVPVQAGLEIGFSGRTTFVDQQKMSIQGFASSSDTRRELHRARWQAKENKVTKTGIPTLFRVASVVQIQAGTPLRCSLRLEVYSGRRRLLGMPWNSQQPLTMEPEFALGTPLESLGFEHMQDQDWEALLHISYPISVSQLYPRPVMRIWPGVSVADTCDCLTGAAVDQGIPPPEA